MIPLNVETKMSPYLVAKLYDGNMIFLSKIFGCFTRALCKVHTGSFIYDFALVDMLYVDCF